ncbi:unnamed protein product, partial [Rotaria sordida]
ELIKYITYLEDLPNELFYEIFNYLDVYHIYQSFYNLNKHLQNLVVNSNFPLKIHLSSISKSNFEDYNRNMIIPNQHRIKLLSLSNPFMIEIMFYPLKLISNFIHLEKLILNWITLEYLIDILKHL